MGRCLECSLKPCCSSRLKRWCWWALCCWTLIMMGWSRIPICLSCSPCLIRIYLWKGQFILFWNMLRKMPTIKPFEMCAIKSTWGSKITRLKSTSSWCICRTRRRVIKKMDKPATNKNQAAQKINKAKEHNAKAQTGSSTNLHWAGFSPSAATHNKRTDNSCTWRPFYKQ